MNFLFLCGWRIEVLVLVSDLASGAFAAPELERVSFLSAEVGFGAGASSRYGRPTP